MTPPTSSNNNHYYYYYYYYYYYDRSVLMTNIMKTMPLTWTT